MADGSHPGGSDTGGSHTSSHPSGSHIGVAQVGGAHRGAGKTLTVEPTTSATSSGLIAGLKSFAAAHGRATAVIEYVGRRGARIQLAGEDGTWGDHFADSTETAREACARAGVSIQNEWERELIELMRPSNDLWRSMGRRFFSR